MRNYRKIGTSAISYLSAVGSGQSQASIPTGDSAVSVNFDLIIRPFTNPPGPTINLPNNAFNQNSLSIMGQYVGILRYFNSSIEVKNTDGVKYFIENLDYDAISFKFGNTSTPRNILDYKADSVLFSTRANFNKVGFVQNNEFVVGHNSTDDYTGTTDLFINEVCIYTTVRSSLSPGVDIEVMLYRFVLKDTFIINSINKSFRFLVKIKG